MEPFEIVRLTERLRRNFGRNADVLNACVQLDTLARAEAHRVALRATVEHHPAFQQARCEECGSSGDVIVRCAGCWTPLRVGEGAPSEPSAVKAADTRGDPPPRDKLPKRDRAAYMRNYRKGRKAC